MKVFLHPFFSQQDKITRKFRLDSDSGVRQCATLATALRGAGHTAHIAVPHRDQVADNDKTYCQTPHTRTVPYLLAVDNLDRRLQWEPGWLRYISGYDIVFTQHEFFPYPLRCLNADTKIVMECGLLPETAWSQTDAMFKLAWDAADLLACNSTTLMQEVSNRTSTPSTVWSFGFDQSLLATGFLRKTIDVLFCSRGSATNYTNHEVFVEAMLGTDYHVVMTDPTRYLLQSKAAPLDWLSAEPLDRDAYVDVLRKSKVVVGLATAGYCGYSFLEAIACGCVPVALRNDAYLEVLGVDYPYYCTLDTVRATVDKAVSFGLPYTHNAALTQRLLKHTYNNAAKTAVTHMEALHDNHVRRPRQMR